MGSHKLARGQPLVPRTESEQESGEGGCLKSLKFVFLLPQSSGFHVLGVLFGRKKSTFRKESPQSNFTIQNKVPRWHSTPSWQKGTFRFKEKRALEGLHSRLISLGHQIALTNDILTN